MIDISKLYSSPCYAASKTEAKEKVREGASSFDALARDSIAEAQEMYENKLFLGSTQRTKLSDTEVAVLANRYDPRNMSDEEYESFLDDLMNMGAISPFERQEMRASGIKVMDGSCHMWAAEAKDGSSPLFHLMDANGDVFRWITDRLKWKESGMTTQEEFQAADERQRGYEALEAIVSRMAAMRPDGGTAKAEDDEGESDIIDQIRDPGSTFYQDIFQRMKLQMEQSEEEKKEQAIIDALDGILEGMRSTDGVTKRKDMVSSMADLSKQISQMDADDPRRAQLDLFRQRLNHMGIYMDLGESIFGGKEDNGVTLTQQLIREKTEGFDPGIFDLI